MKSEETTATANCLGVFESVLSATGASFVEGKISVWDYSNSEHFSSLWKTLEDESLKTASRVLIIWPHTPPDESLFPVNTKDNVSPLHWAACAAKKCPQIHVCVLDLNPTAHRNEYLYEYYLSCEKRRLPWMTVVQAAHFFGNESISGEFLPDASAIEIEALNGRLFPQLGAKRRIEAEHFIDRIRNELTSPRNAEGRHAIANVVAPMLLNADAVPSAHSRALSVILRQTCELSFDKRSSREGYPGFDLGSLHIAEPELLLIDDQAGHGWYAWLVQQSRRLFGVRKGKAVAPVSLLTIGDFLSQVQNYVSAPFRLRFTTSDAERKGPQVVLLDLRLFSGSSFIEEVRFLTRIVDLCAKHLPPTHSDYDWAEKMRGDISIVRTWLNAPVKEATGHHLALTLPARLISLLDFSLPVIIFSSTGQTSILKHFANHPNIITDFEKPRFFALEGAAIVENTEAKLHRAIEKALGFIVGRCKCNALLNLPQPRGGGAHPSTHVELYLDETGNREDPDFAVGGCFAVFNHPVNAVAAADQFDETLYKHGVLYFRPVCFAPVVPVKSKRHPCDSEMLLGLTEAGQTGCRPEIGFVRILANNTQPPLSLTGDLLDSNSADNRFINALTALLEVFLFESLPLILGKKSLKDCPHVSVSVFVATRAPELLPDEASEVEYKYGHYRPGGGNQLQTFNTDDVAKLVRALSDLHDISVKAERLLGIPLVYDNPGFGKAPRHAERFIKLGSKKVVHWKTKPGWFPDAVRDAHQYLQRSFNMSAADLTAYIRPDYRSLHYVADEIISGDNVQTAYSSIFTGTVPGQFDGAFDYSVRDVSRFLDRGQIADALIALRLPSARTAIRQAAPDSRMLAALRCARSLEDVSADEFSRFSTHCRMTMVAESKVFRGVEEVETRTRHLDSAVDRFADYLRRGPESVFISGVKSSDHFVSEIRKKVKRLYEEVIEDIKLFQDFRGVRCVFLKYASAVDAQNVTEHINKTSWGWKAQQCTPAKSLDEVGKEEADALSAPAEPGDG